MSDGLFYDGALVKVISATSIMRLRHSARVAHLIDE